mgnify:CR=1 FL=1
MKKLTPQETLAGIALLAMGGLGLLIAGILIIVMLMLVLR